MIIRNHLTPKLVFILGRNIFELRCKLNENPPGIVYTSELRHEFKQIRRPHWIDKFDPYGFLCQKIILILLKEAKFSTL
jgi:hypothetical protein